MSSMDATFGQSLWQYPRNVFLCGTDYLRVTFTRDLPSQGSEVSHVFLTTFPIGIEDLTIPKVAAEFFLSDRDFPM